MQINWINNSNNENLIIIALGWGASPEVIENQILPANTDVVALYDYKDLHYSTLDLNIAKYKSKILIAWSFGVWASEQLFANEKFDKTIAIAGSPYPIHREYGINPRIFALTVKGILNDGVAQFVVRMCGKHLREYFKHHSTRELTDIQQELQSLNINGQKPYNPSLNWSNAIILADDLIFPPRALEKYWQTTTANIEILQSVPHYPFYDNEFILCRINH